MGAVCTKIKAVTEEEAQDADIKRKLDHESRMDKRVQKLLLLGAGESGKSTIFKQIKILFQTDYSDSERKTYVPVIHANVFQSIRTLLIGCKEFAESGEQNSSKYVLQLENQEFGERLAEIDNSNNFPKLNEETAIKVRNCWRDPAVKEAFNRGNELQLPDCAAFFLDHVLRLAAHDYTPSQDDILYARQQTKGIVETEFSPMNERGSVYKLFDVGGQRNERRKWMHLFDGVTAIIFCVALSEYDQTLLEDDKKNRMMETKELFDWLLKEPWFAETSFLVFLNKYDIFENKALKVPLTVCEWFQDYQPITTSCEEVDHAYMFVEQKFREAYERSTPSSNIHRLFEVYKTTAINRNVVKKTFDLVDHSLTIRRLARGNFL